MSPRVPAEIRQQVKARAQGRCEYCHKPEGFSLYPHHVDHIIAPMHGGTNDLDNLAWACFQCNVAKGSNIASYDEITHQLTALYHPRHDSWADHFQWLEAVIHPRTDIGRVTVRILQVNHEDEITLRDRLMRAKRW